MERIAVITSGGDAPGMNAAIRAAVRTGIGRGVTVFGVRNGYEGLMEGSLFEADSIFVGGIIGRGGTVLRSGRSERFKTAEGVAAGAEHLKSRGIQGAVIIGGDGSLRGARELSLTSGIAVIGVPASIDNDIPGTATSIGFDTAINTAVEAADKIRDTAYSHDRVFVIEVMGRQNGFIAVETGLASGAEAILIPEVPYSLDDICVRLTSGHDKGKKSSIIIVAEGATSAAKVRDVIAEKTGYEVRYLVLGHMQRGGNPTAWDRVLATRFGSAAVQALMAGRTREMVGFDGKQITYTPLDDVLSTRRTVDPEKLLLAEVMAQ
jgi:6-phosphofructokinase 1